MSLRSLFIVTVLLASQVGLAAPKLCVLNFERAGYPIAKVVDSVFEKSAAEDSAGVRLKDEAVPVDFLNCIKERFSEIVVIAHAVKVTYPTPTVVLGYYVRLPAEEVKGYIAAGKTELISELSEEYVRDPLPFSPKDPDSAARQKDLSDEISYLDQWDVDKKPLHRIAQFLPKIFELIRVELAKQAASSQGIGLKRLRWMSCMPENIFDAYPDLKKAISVNSIALDIAPASAVFSFLEGFTVTQPDRSWLEESVGR